VQRLEQEVKRSPRVRRLLVRQSPRLQGLSMAHPYHYWQGVHWVLPALAELGYPAGDAEIFPALDRVLDAWTRPNYFRSVEVDRMRPGLGIQAVPVIAGKARRCASVQGNGLLASALLGPPDERADRIVELLLRWQWPDGGWNCAKSPDASVSSFMETLVPTRALAAHARRARSAGARDAALRAAEVFLTRRLFRRRRDGAVMRSSFLELHYPVYWHYDVLAGLKGMVEVGRIRDPRCGPALDWLESRELANGGWPADATYFRYSAEWDRGADFVDWGSPSPRIRNPWVTTDALYVLREAGRLAL
jgi:hypothetical protein